MTLLLLALYLLAGWLFGRACAHASATRGEVLSDAIFFSIALFWPVWLIIVVTSAPPPPPTRPA